MTKSRRKNPLGQKMWFLKTNARLKAFIIVSYDTPYSQSTKREGANYGRGTDRSLNLVRKGVEQRQTYLLT